MGCHTWVLKKITKKEDCIRLIKAEIKSSQGMLNFYMNEPEFFDEFRKDVKGEIVNYFNDCVKPGYIMHDPDYVFYYHLDGRWIYADELTLKDEFTEYQLIIEACQNALNTLTTFDELKNFILEHKHYMGCTFSEELNENADENDERYCVIEIIDNDIYVHSTNIQTDAFENCDHFRIYGYPSDFDDDDIDFFRSSPAGEPVRIWSNAEDLIVFLEWYKTKRDYLPEVNGIEVQYGEKLYQVIRDFFKVNEGKNLAVHFG